jgi:hypothetical protein
MTTPSNLEEELHAILAKLWCAVDVEDVTEELIDVGEIDDATDAILALLQSQRDLLLDELLAEMPMKVDAPKPQPIATGSEFTPGIYNAWGFNDCLQTVTTLIQSKKNAA